MGNSIVFPAPQERSIPLWMESRMYFYPKPKRSDEFENVPTTSFSFSFCCDNRKIEHKIPYLYFKEATEPSKKQYLMIYFHGNSENLTHTFKVLENYHKTLKIDVLAPEYPGYGLYNTESPSEESILNDAELIIRYSIEKLGYREENIILVGRSLGTGVAARMGAEFTRIRGLILITPFLSIREVANSVLGKMIGNYVPNIFRTREIIWQIKCPLLLIHGIKDRVVPCTNSTFIYDLCLAPKMIYLSLTMEHERSNFKFDIYLPMLRFFIEKLKMLEFQEQYDTEDIERVPVLSSLDRSLGISLPDNNHKKLEQPSDSTQEEIENKINFSKEEEKEEESPSDWATI